MATLEQVNTLLADIQTGIVDLTDDNDAELLVSLKGKLEEVKGLLSAAQSESVSGDNLSGEGGEVSTVNPNAGGRRRSAKKRGTQRKQKRRQRRGSRRAY